jgi:hypothetical protein
MPDRLVQQHRATAIFFGLAGRVRPDAPPSDDGTKPSTTSLEVLARDLASDLEPEFGSLQVTFAEIAPVLGWAVDGGLPRGENEYLVRQRLLGVDDLAAAVSRRGDHVHFSELATSSPVGGEWEYLTTQPPRPARRAERTADDAARGRPQSLKRETRPRRHKDTAFARRADGSGQQSARGQQGHGVLDYPASRLAALIAVKDADEASRRDTIGSLIGDLPRRMTELVPWDRERSEDVKTARAAARPPMDARRTVACAAFAPDSHRVRAALELARGRGWSLLSVEGTADEARALAPALDSFLAGLEGCSGAVLGVAKFKDRSGTQNVNTELVFVCGGSQ